MDINVTRQAVCINEVIFDQSAEQAIDTDFSLPDYCPDIVRLLKMQNNAEACFEKPCRRHTYG